MPAVQLQRSCLYRDYGRMRASACCEGHDTTLQPPLSSAIDGSQSVAPRRRLPDLIRTIGRSITYKEQVISYFRGRLYPGCTLFISFRRRAIGKWEQYWETYPYILYLLHIAQLCTYRIFPGNVFRPRTLRSRCGTREPVECAEACTANYPPVFYTATEIRKCIGEQRSGSQFCT